MSFSNSRAFTIALAGNPNTGKSTLFNILTGSHQHIGNWPGKTIEKHVGVWRHEGQAYQLVDLPGVYSLSAYTLEEQITRSYILEEHPDVVVVTVDASNLERNLYLTAQILEMGPPAVIALNMCDVAAAHGLQIDDRCLAAHLGVPIVRVIARKRQGLDPLKRQIAQLVGAQTHGFPSRGDDAPREGETTPFAYGPEIEEAIASVQRAIAAETGDRRWSARWLAIKLVEGDTEIAGVVAAHSAGESLLAAAQTQRTRLRNHFAEDVDTLIAEQRYEWINQVTRTCTQRRTERVRLSDQIDRIATHPWLGIPLFLAIMWVVFKLTIDASAPAVGWISQTLSGPVSSTIVELFQRVGLEESWVESLLVDGIVAGVGGVLVFIPVLSFLYLALGALEDSGYLARAAFVMDRFMRVLGLHGKSFLPLMLGFGCNVPAIYATRTLEHPRDRLLTGLLTPFMSCGARLPVYVLFAAIFFPRHGNWIVYALYMLGILAALLIGWILSRTAFKSRQNHGLLLELPPYRLPTLRNLWFYLWERLREFLHGAATVILGTSLAVWLLMAIPVGGSGVFAQTPVAGSAFARLASFLTPVFAPLGFASWENSSALVSGFVAKEVVVSTLTQAYGAESANGGTEERLAQAVQSSFARSSEGHAGLAAFAFMVFVLLYTPCMAVVAAERQEFGARWALFSMVGQFIIAWLAAWVVFQGGRLLGVG